MYRLLYGFEVVIPEVLTVSELRAGLAATLSRVRQRGAGPVFVGSRRRPEAVVMSTEHYTQLVDLAEKASRQQAVQDAIGIVQVDGIDPGPVGRAAMDAYAGGEIDGDAAMARVLEHYRQTS